MKYFLVLVIAVFVSQNSLFGKEKIKTVYFGKLPLGSLQVKLEVQEDWNDPGEFTSLKIIKGNEVIFSIANLQGSKLKSVLAFPAGTKSLGQYLKTIPVSTKSDNAQYFLAFSNWVGGSSDDEFVLLKMSGNNKPKEVFHQSIEVASIKDYNGDGLLDILKTGGRGEPVANNNFSYDPYLVYLQIANSNSTEFKIDENLSKSWSLENKFEWHGSKYEEKIRVDKNGKVMP
ncbi:MAG: hypothetical protein ACXVLQ_16385 [Bacteriovorax sp.]